MRAVKTFVAAALALAAGVLHAQRGQPPQFSAEVNYVEVDARVVDRQNQLIRGLSQKDFAVFEDGVRQTVTNFSVVDIPIPAAAEGRATPPVRRDVADNIQGGDRRRTYLIVLDGNSISPRLTNPVRAFLKNFIDRSVGPDDLVGMTTLGPDAAYENFTSNK